MAAMAGCSVRTTNGSATRLCAMGISSGKERTSSGGRLKLTTYPNPRVTAEVPSGSISSASSQRFLAPARLSA